MNKHLNEFFQLNCAGDIINAVTPVRKMAKEITEAMSVRRQLKKLVLKEENKMKYTILDLCAGNGLTGILAVFTLPVKFCHAMDIKPRTREGYRTVRRWEYLERNILEPDGFTIEDDSIIISSHPCGKLAESMIKTFNSRDRIKAIVMIPCCIEKSTIGHMPRLLEQKGLSKYDIWSLSLLDMCRVPDKLKDCFKDNHILSPANNVIWAKKE